MDYLSEQFKQYIICVVKWCKNKKTVNNVINFNHIIVMNIKQIKSMYSIIEDEKLMKRKIIICICFPF